MSRVQLTRQRRPNNTIFMVDVLLKSCLQFLADDLSQWTVLVLVSKNWRTACHCPTILRIIHVRCKTNNYTNNFCQNLPTQLGLCHLDLGGSSAITNVGMQALTSLTSLQTLSLRKTKITDIGMQGITNLTALRLLDISYTVIGNVGLHALSGLTLLNSLDLKHTGVTNVGLSCISGLTSLRELDVRQTKITEQAIQNTSGFSSLKHVFCAPIPDVPSYWPGIHEEVFFESSDDESSSDDEKS